MISDVKLNEKDLVSAELFLHALLNGDKNADFIIKFADIDSEISFFKISLFLINSKLVASYVVVKNSSNKEVGRYNTLTEVPVEIFDIFNNKIVCPNMDNVNVYFTLK